jgi:aminoglycoside phosphotransferase
MSLSTPDGTATTIESPRVETPGPESDFADRVTELCPDFRADGPVRPARKSELLWGHVGGRAVIAKRLRKPNAVWEWYLEHEIATYRMFAVHPPGVWQPRLVAAGPGLLVIEQLAGEPLATKRRPAAALPIRAIGALLAVHDQLAHYTPKSPAPPPPPRVRAQLRERLLEDPSEPTWIRDGVRLSGRRGLLGEELAHEIDHALAAYTPVAFAHGDLLLRNVIGDPDDDEHVGLVDWECAGVHPRDWDLALLWTQLAGPARGIVEDAVRDSGVRWRAFLGLVAFAFARELRFLDAFPNNAGPRAEVERELAAIAARFAQA